MVLVRLPRIQMCVKPSKSTSLAVWQSRSWWANEGDPGRWRFWTDRNAREALQFRSWTVDDLCWCWVNEDGDVYLRPARFAFISGEGSKGRLAVWSEAKHDEPLPSLVEDGSRHDPGSGHTPISASCRWSSKKTFRSILICFVLSFFDYEPLNELKDLIAWGWVW